MNIDKSILKLIRQTVLRFIPDSEILLFGSRARQDNDLQSDYDILIITKSEMNVHEKFLLKTLIRKTLLMQGILSDILIQSEQEIHIKKTLPGHIIKSIMREGIQI